MEEADIRQAIIDDIDDLFGYAAFGDLEVILRKKDGWINVAELCKQAGKHFKHWLANKAAKEMIAMFESEVGISSALDRVHKGLYRTRGTYAHPELAVHIAAWCSFKFAMMVSKVTIAHITAEAVAKKEALLRKKDIIIKKRGDKIDRLRIEMREQFDAQQAKVDQVLDAIGYVQSQNVGLEKHLIDVKHKLRIASTDRVMPTRNEDDYPILAIVYNGTVWITADDDDSDDSERSPLHDYSVIRAAKGNLSAMLKRITDKYPEAVIVYQLENPNAIVSWKYYLQKHGKYLIRKSCQFSLVEGYSEERFLRHVKRCDQKKMKDVEA